MSDDLAERLRLPSFSKRDRLAAADRIEELEAKLAQQDDLVQAAILALMGYDAKAAGAKDAGEGFDLAINVALAALREGGE